MDFVLTSIDAEHMTFIEICKAEIEKSKIWLVLGYFLQKWLIFLENDWFELWISFSRQWMRNIQRWVSAQINLISDYFTLDIPVNVRVLPYSFPNFQIIFIFQTIFFFAGLISGIWTRGTSLQVLLQYLPSLDFSVFGPALLDAGRRVLCNQLRLSVCLSVCQSVSVAKVLILPAISFFWFFASS